MSNLTNLKLRVNHLGGSPKERMNEDKLRSLKYGLSHSYQAETAVLSDGREFKCLINPNKLSMELDDKMLSIPFADVCLNGETQDIVTIGVKPGDIIEWKENGTHWLVYNRYLQEEAYFRGLMRQCDVELDINGRKTWAYLKGPSEKGIDWSKSKHFVFNDLNYTLELYISKDVDPNGLIQRFTKLIVEGKPWEVQAVDRLTTEGILAIYLKEDYVLESIINEETPVEPEEEPVAIMRGDSLKIIGPATVHAFDIVHYSIEGTNQGFWSLSNKRGRILRQSPTFVEIEIVSGKHGDMTLTYHAEGQDVKLNISILSI